MQKLKTRRLRRAVFLWSLKRKPLCLKYLRHFPRRTKLSCTIIFPCLRRSVFRSGERGTCCGFENPYCLTDGKTVGFELSIILNSGVRPVEMEAFRKVMIADHIS